MRPFLATQPPLLFAHRGGAALWPENTLLAFRESLELGIEYLETDIHATSDGVLVAHHDDSVQRTTNGFGLIRHYAFSDLRRLDAGYWHTTDGGKTYPCRGLGLQIPTLAEVLSLSDSARLNVEIKQAHPSIVGRFLDFIAAHGVWDRLLVAAANHRILREFRKAAGGRMATSASEAEVKAFWAAARLGLADRIPIHFDALQVPEQSGHLTVVTPGFLAAAHRRGLHVHVWTVDDPNEMRRLIALGVDGVMSDRPDRLMTLR